MPDNLIPAPKYVPNEYFTEKLNGKILITTRHGSWIFIEPKEYESLRTLKLEENENLFSRLEQAGILITKNSVSRIVKMLEHQYSFLKLNKMLYIIGIGNSCNLACAYCHANAVSPKNIEGKSMPPEVMSGILDYIVSAPHNELAIQFQGGEPLMHFGAIKDFLERLYSSPDIARSKKRIEHVVIVTNLTNMTEEKAEYIISKNIGMCVSLDGPKKLHDMQRAYIDGRGSYDDIIYWITYFKKRGAHFSMLPTTTSNTLKFGAKALIDEYVKWGCKRILFKPVMAIGRAKNSDSLAVTAEDFFEFWKEGVEYLIELDSAGIHMYDMYAQSLIRNVFLPHRAYMCARRPCGASISQTAFSEKGDIYSCDFSRSMPDAATGNVFKDNYQSTWFKTLDLKTFTTEFQPLCDTCSFSAYCACCTSRNMAVYKDIMPHSPNDFNCRLTKLALSYIFEKTQSKKHLEVFMKWVSTNE